MIIETKDGTKIEISNDNYYKVNFPEEFKDLVSLLKKTRITNIAGALKFSSKDEKRIHLKNWIEEITSFLDKRNDKKPVKLTERIYCILNGIVETPKCKYCGESPVKFLTFKDGYRKACNSKDCRLKASEESVFQKYGVRHYLSTKEAHEKSKKTFVRKYGVDNPMKVSSIKNKALNTMKEKYGGIGLQRKDVLEKAKKAIVEKYGVSNPMKCEHIRKKQKQVQQKQETVLKRILTVKEKYGVDNVSQLPDVKRKAYLTLVSRKFGIEKNIEKWFDKEFWVKEFVENNGTVNVKKASDFFNVSTQTVRKHLWRLGLEDYRPTYSSIEEQTISNIVSDLYGKDIIRNSKSIIPPFEIDIYLPDVKIGIEYDGLFWHSIGNEIINNYDEIRRRKWNKYHKYNKADSQGIRLFTIQEHLWKTKQEIIISMLKTLLGIQSLKIPARKCKIVEIDSNTAFSFFEENHIQGGVFSKFNFGLEYNGELMQVISFTPYRFKNSEKTVELTRFASKIDTIVVGGFSKLLKHSEAKLSKLGFERIITFADRLYSVGSIYLNNGFTLVELTKPNYYYIDKNGNVYHRMKFQKHRLKDKLEFYDESLTEQENMIVNGYRILYDAGHLKLEKNIIHNQ